MLHVNRPYRLILPALSVLAILFVGGLLTALLRSFSYMPVIGLTDPGFDAYVRVLTSDDFYRALAFSLYTATTATLLSAILAVGTILVLRRSFAGRNIALFLFQLNLTIPHIVGALGMLYLLSQSGLLARLAAASGIVTESSQFPILIYDAWGIGIIFHYVWKETPFIALMLLSSLQTIGADHEQVARTLGATPIQSFRHVIIPAIAPGLAWGSTIAFAFIFGAFEVPLLLGASQPQALPVFAYRKYADVDLAARPDAMAITLIMAAFTITLVLIYRGFRLGHGSRS